MSFPAPLWLIGCGNMGGAMLRRWIAAGMDAQDVTVITRSGAADVPEGVRVLSAPPPDAEPEAIVLAMKPQQLADVAPMVSAVNPPLLLSILAGVEEKTLADRIQAGAVVRAMPNLPVALGKGVIALHSEGAGADARVAAAGLATPLGHVEWIEDVAHFDLVTALAGSGPAFLFRFVDALASAGARLGLAPDQAARLAMATVEGSAAMAHHADVGPAALADRVASKGGSTRAGLNVLDEGEALVDLLSRTLAAARDRNREMAAEARG